MSLAPLIRKFPADVFLKMTTEMRMENNEVRQTRRQEVYDRITSTADQLLEELDVLGVIRDPLMLLFVHGQTRNY